MISFPLKNWLPVLHREKETEKRANSLAFECWPLAGLFATHDDRDPQSKPLTTPICILHDTSGAGAFHHGQSDCRHDTIETTTYTTSSAHSEPSWRVEILHLRRCSKNSLMIRLTSCCSSNIHQPSQDVSLVSGDMRCDDNIRTVRDGKFFWGPGTNLWKFLHHLVAAVLEHVDVHFPLRPLQAAHQPTTEHVRNTGVLLLLFSLLLTEFAWHYVASQVFATQP